MIHLITKKDLLKTYYVLGTILGPMVTAVIKLTKSCPYVLNLLSDGVTLQVNFVVNTLQDLDGEKI